MEPTTARAWAHEEFGDVSLGDSRLTARVVRTASGALLRPSSTVSKTFGRTAAAEGAFRLLENPRVSVEELGNASHRAAARRCDACSNVIVPIDGTSIRIRDTWDLRGLGPLSSLTDKARGIQALHALAVAPTGATLGVLGRQFWLRSTTSTRGTRSKNMGPHEERESYRWVTMLSAVTEQLRTHAPNCTPWFQIDRAGDSWMVLEHAVLNKLQITVRANQNRALGPRSEHGSHLFPAIRAKAPIGVLDLEVPEGRKRARRRARLVVRSARIQIPMPNAFRSHRLHEIGVVMVTEESPPADGTEPIEWTLLTTHALRHVSDAIEVVRAYTQRWRIEEFHRTWKRGACGIEQTRLRANDHIQRWAVIMGSVAARIEHLKVTSRSSPDLPADGFYSQDEIDAVILLKSKDRKLPYSPGDIPTHGEITRWVADLGGYMGSKNSLPPGSTVIARGMERIEMAAQILALQRQKRIGRSKKKM